jgi:shikimate kinase
MKPLLKLDRPVALVGMMGAGKCEAGRVLAGSLGIPFFDSDLEVEQKAGATIAELFEREGEAGFRQRERETIAALLPRGLCILATGGGAMAEAGTRSMLLENALAVWLQAEPQVLLARLGDTSSRPLLKGPDPLRTLRRLLEERKPDYSRASIHIRTHEDTAEETANRIAEALAAHISRA